MPTVEERLATIETKLEERARESDRRMSAIESSVTGLAAAVTGMATAMATLSETTRAHAFRAACINGGAKVLSGGGAASGIAALIFFLGNRLGWW